MSTDLENTLYIFMLATFLGLEVIRKVSPLLHTPLMSLTNAISAISVIGAIMITGAEGATTLSKVLGFIAITAAVTNIVSGYLITDRMLRMFKKPGGKKYWPTWSVTSTSSRPRCSSSR
jgi:NAD(P) transhydrogenase subunit alpha